MPAPAKRWPADPAILARLLVMRPLKMIAPITTAFRAIKISNNGSPLI
jgi:hypothetical protein